MAKTGKKKKNRRSRAQRLADMKRKVAQEEAKLALESLLTAVKDGNVDDENVKEYKKLLRYLRVMEKAPDAFSHFGMEDEAASSAKLRDKIIKKLKAMLNESGDGGDDDPELEPEDADDEEDEDDEDDEDEEEDEDDEDDDDDDDF